MNHRCSIVSAISQASSVKPLDSLCRTTCVVKSGKIARVAFFFRIVLQGYRVLLSTSLQSIIAQLIVILVPNIESPDQLFHFLNATTWLGSRHHTYYSKTCLLPKMISCRHLLDHPHKNLPHPRSRHHPHP